METDDNFQFIRFIREFHLQLQSQVGLPIIFIKTYGGIIPR